jgi:hypothetical protein
MARPPEMESALRSAARGRAQRTLVTTLADQGCVRIAADTLDESVVNLVHRIRRLGYNVKLRPLETAGAAGRRTWEVSVRGQLSEAEQAIFLGGDPATAARVNSALGACGADPDGAFVATVYALLRSADTPRVASGDPFVELRAAVRVDRAVVTAVYLHGVEAPRVMALHHRTEMVAQAIDRLDTARLAMLAADYASERGLALTDVIALRERRRATSDEWCEAADALEGACALTLTEDHS